MCIRDRPLLYRCGCRAAASSGSFMRYWTGQPSDHPTDDARRHFAASATAPCECLNECIDLIVMAPRKSQQFRGEFLEPSGAPGKTNRTSRKQVALSYYASTLVGIGLVGRDVDRFFAQALDETTTDRGVLDQKRGRAIALLDLHHLAFERVEWKAAMYHLKNVEDLLAPQQ